MTQQRCARLAQLRGYPIFGLQYFSECWAGWDLARAQSLGPATCDKPCTADARQTCGGDWANTLFSF